MDALSIAEMREMWERPDASVHDTAYVSELAS
jgi:hypothetical protein